MTAMRPPGFEVAGEVLQVDLALLDVMEHVVDEREVDSWRQQGIVELGEYGFDVGDALLGAQLDDVLEKLLVDFDRVQLAARPDRTRQRQAEHSGSGADVRDEHAGLELERRDDFADFQALKARGRVERLDPLLGGSRAQLRGGRLGPAGRRQERRQRQQRW